jgi:membrane protein YdbS with pleckstrin-like domain
MALISCPECGKEVSSRAASCPHCGFGLAGTAAPVAAAALGLTAAAPSAPEQTLWESSPSLLLLLGEAVGVLAVVLLVVLLAVFLLPALGEVARNSWLDTAKAPLILSFVLGAYLLVRGIRIAVRAARLRATRYRLTNQRLVVETGLVSRTLAEVDLRSVEDLVFRQGPMDRLLGVGSISVVSSDRNTPRLQLVGVKDPKGTRELIRTQAYALTQRQLFTRAT